MAHVLRMSQLLNLILFTRSVKVNYQSFTKITCDDRGLRPFSTFKYVPVSLVAETERYSKLRRLAIDDATMFRIGSIILCVLLLSLTKANDDNSGKK